MSMPDDVLDYFQHGIKLYYPDGKLQGMGRLQADLLNEGFTKAELKGYVKKGFLESTPVKPSRMIGKERQIMSRMPNQTMYYVPAPQK